MTYKLIKVDKTETRENFDRSSVEGDSFTFDCAPKVGSRLSAHDISKDRYLTTSVIQNIIAIENTIKITTKHTIYTFMMVGVPNHGD